MGNCQGTEFSQELLKDLKSKTPYTDQEIFAWYQDFQKNYPSGYVTREQFEGIYSRFFPDADSKAYAQHAFRSFDSDNNGTLNFKEYIVALHLTSSGKTIQKIEWAFALYDVDKNGSLTKYEIKEIVKSVFKMISIEEKINLPYDENTPEKRTDKIWSLFGKKECDRITEGEFIQGVMVNKDILRLLHIDDEPQG